VRALVTALRTLTILPVPGREADPLAAALPSFPLVGALLGTFLAGVSRGMLHVAPGWALGAAVATTVAEVALTGGLHLDGLADAADSLGAGGDREKALAVMKDSRVGAFGVMAVGCALLLKVAAYTEIATAPGTWSALCGAFVASRLTMVHLSAFLPYARAEGGIGGAFVAGARKGHYAAALGLAVVLCALAGPGALCLLAAGVALSCIAARWCNRRFGGVTGDLLGACAELVLLALLMAAAVVAARFGAWPAWSAAAP